MSIFLPFKQRFTDTFLLFFLAISCSPLIGPYSPTAYENATSLKAETLSLMEKAMEPYSDHKKAAESLAIELRKAHEYVKGVPSNSITARQWEILIKQDGDLIGKFMQRWKERETLSKIYIEEFDGLISDAFDEIICLEANKKGATKCVSSGGE